MSQLLVQNYLNEIDRLRKYTGSVTEGVISEAFKDLLKAWSRQLNWQFSAQFPFQSVQKTRIVPDGTIFHSIGLPFGYWEAKDTADDLDVEIRKKLARGYPQDNIIFENSETAVLIQDRNEAFRCSMTDTDALLKLLDLFFGYEREAIREFRKAVEEFRGKLPYVLEELRKRIEAAYATNADFRSEAKKFLEHCKDTINPTLGEADVREMLIQHILTEEIFASVFNEGDFHHENNIARKLYALEGKFFTGAVKKETMAGLNAYYSAIKSNAANISDHAGKQTFLKVIYENFYKVYNPKAADRLGVVYTPNEIVKFMIEGADWLCQKHFGKALIDPGVEILDPATGTGTFVCELLEHFRGQPQKLAHKYKNELHANEVAILPYYVANLNIEATYAAITGQFAEFPNLCFVDTLDNVAGLDIKADHQHDLFGAMSEENIERVRRQNQRKISVIIGNPPYNANQQNENDNNKNREYKRIDELIKSSYIRLSTAQKTKVYDMYARFFRWASDRLHDDGVLAFVTNRSFIDSRTFDGFRRAVAEEFHEAYVIDLKGNARNSGERRQREGGNVFDDQIKVGIAVSFWVKKRKAKGFTVRYEAVRDYAKSDEKRSFLATTPLAQRKFELVVPSKDAVWINLTNNDWDDLIPSADRKTKSAKSRSQGRAIFQIYSLGVSTNRDEWLYGWSEEQVAEKARLLTTRYDRTPQAIGQSTSDLKWSETLLRRKRAGVMERFSEDRITRANYRPFFKQFLYRSDVLIDRPGLIASLFPTRKDQNKAICFNDIGSRSHPCVLAIDAPADLHFGAAVDAYQQLPRYRYTASGERVDNITDWALKEFQKAYGRDGRGTPAKDGEGGDSPTSPLRGGRAEGAGGGIGADAAEGTPTPDPSPQGGGGLGQSPATPPGGFAATLPLRGRDSRALGKDDIFHYVYALLHDPLYREKYALNLKREFPRIPFHPDFWRWAAWGEELMALHVGYETVEPWPLVRTDTPDEKARAAGVSPKALLKADRDNGMIRLDTETTLSGIPSQAWDYRLGNRSGLDWILDQYREKTPKDPTIRERFNTYRFADYKEKVVDLIARVARVSVETVAITQAMKEARR